MREFLASYDYGMGGLWWWIEAESADAIHAAYCQLEVLEVVPDWWESRGMNSVPIMHIRLGDPPPPGLAQLKKPSND